MHRHLLLLLTLAAAFAQAPAPAPKPAAPAPAGNPVVLAVGDQKMTRSDFEDFINGLPEQVRDQVRAPLARRQLAEQLAELMILAQEARKRKMDQNPAIRQQVAVQVDRALATALYQEILAAVKVDDAMLRALYEKNKTQYEQVRARHILVRFQGSKVPLKPNQKDLTEAEALARIQELRKKVLDGGDFAAVAKAESDDAGSAAVGGDLSSFGRGQMIPAFEEVAFKLPPGQVSEPVKTPFGWHLIKVEQHTNKAFEDVRADLEKQARPEQARQAVEAMKKQNPATLDNQYFAPPAAPAPQPAPPK